MIEPGMMVECINDKLLPGKSWKHWTPLIKGNKYFIIAYGIDTPCNICQNCKPVKVAGICDDLPMGFCQSRFKPIGGTEEIEQQMFKKVKV